MSGKQIIGPHTITLDGYPIMERQELSDAYDALMHYLNLPWVNFMRAMDDVEVVWNKSMADIKAELAKPVPEPTMD